MKSLIKITILTVFPFAFIILFSGQTSAQCISCTMSIENKVVKCETDSDGDQGHTSCTCNGGCECTGLCGFGTEPIENIQQSNLMQFLIDYEKPIPNSGLLVKLDVKSASTLREDFKYPGYLGSKILPSFYLNDKFAIYKVKSNHYLIYKVVGGEVNIYNCDNDQIGIIKDKQIASIIK